MPESNKAVFTAVLADLAIAAAKLTAFFFTRSSAMLSEAIHSVVDAGNSSLLLLGIHRSRKPPDELHPFGYGKELYFWTLLVALFIFLVGGGVSVAEGIRRVLHPEPITHLLWSYITLAAAACFEGYSLYIGLREFKASEGTAATLRSIHASKDPSNFTVIIEDSVALFGLVTAFVGTLLDQLLGWHLADGIASITIGAGLMLVSLLLIVESKALLVGEGASIETLREIRQLTLAQPGVERVGYPLTMYFGPDNILLTMNVRFARQLSRDDIEHTIDTIESAIHGSFPHITQIYLEAESIRSNPRLSDPSYPSATDLPPRQIYR